MKRALLGVVVLIAALVIGLATTATFLGEGLAGYLLIYVAILIGAAHWLPHLFAPKRQKIIFLLEKGLGIFFMVVCIFFAIFIGLTNAMFQRIFVWLLLTGLTLIFTSIWQTFRK